MPATTTVRHTHAPGMKHSQRNASHGKLAHHNRSTSAIKLHGGQLQGGHSNFAVTAFKAREELVKRSESSNTIRLDHTSGNKAAGFHGRGHLGPRKSGNNKSDNIRKAKFVMTTERDASPDEEDDDDQWVSSGVVTPDDREPETETPATELQCSSTPKVIDSQGLGSSQNPTVTSNSVPTGLPEELSKKLISGGHRTAPTSRAPSIKGRSAIIRPLSTVSVHDARPSLIRTSSLTPTAPPLTTTSTASAQITSTNPQPDERAPVNYYTPIHTSPPGSLSSSRTTQHISNPSFFRRPSTSSSLRSSLTHPSFPQRDRKSSMLSNTPTALQVAKSPPPYASAAFNSLSAIPRPRSAPPPLVSHFPPIPVRTPAEEAFGLFPPPYLAAHMAVRAYESPLQDSFARVVSLRIKGHPMAISGC